MQYTCQLYGQSINLFPSKRAIFCYF